MPCSSLFRFSLFLSISSPPASTSPYLDLVELKLALQGLQARVEVALALGGGGRGSVMRRRRGRSVVGGVHGVELGHLRGRRGLDLHFWTELNSLFFYLSGRRGGGTREKRTGRGRKEETKRESSE